MSYGLALAKHIFSIVCSKNRPLFSFQEVLDQSGSLRDKEKGAKTGGGPRLCFLVNLVPSLQYSIYTPLSTWNSVSYFYLSMSGSLRTMPCI